MHLSGLHVYSVCSQNEKDAQFFGKVHPYDAEKKSQNFSK